MIKQSLATLLQYLSITAAWIVFLSNTLHADIYKPGVLKTTSGEQIEGSILFNPLTPGFVSVLFFPSDINTFTARQVEYFQVEGENPYVSRTITFRDKEQIVFLEKVVSGPLTYLYLKHRSDRFFVEIDKIVELTSANILEDLKTLAPDCERWQQQLKNTHLNHRKVRFIAEEINKGNCRNIPYSTFGVSTGRFLAHHIISKEVLGENLPFDLDKSEYNYTLGLFLEIPLWKVPLTHLRFQTGIYRHQVNQTFLISPSLYSVAKIRRTDMMIEILPVFQLNTKILRPYFLAGPSININLNNQSESETRVPTQIGIRTRFKQINVNTISVAITVGAGIKYHYNPKNYITLELKNSHLNFGNKHNVNIWQIGFSFNIISY